MTDTRRYETIFIAKPELAPDDLKGLTDKVRDIVTQGAGQIVKLDEWGVRRLAYVVKRQSRGYYYFLDYAAGQALVKELERNLKIDDRVIKFLTVKVEDAFQSDVVVAGAGEEETEQAGEDTAQVTETPTETRV